MISDFYLYTLTFAAKFKNWVFKFLYDIPAQETAGN
jgi:hypothetical protein